MKKPFFNFLSLASGFRALFFFGNISSVLVCFFLITSCKKDEKELEPTTEPESPAQTATVQPLPDFIKIENSSPKIQITSLNVSITGVKPVYSYDLDGDGTADIAINYSKPTWHGLPVQNTVDFEAIDKDTYILADSIYQFKTYDCNSTISITNVNKLSPRGLVFNDTIQVDNKNWRNGSFALYYYDQEMDTHACHKQYIAGLWNQYSAPRYVAIKCKGKLGWFKMQVYSADYSNFLEYALYKQ